MGRQLKLLGGGSSLLAGDEFPRRVRHGADTQADGKHGDSRQRDELEHNQRPLRVSSGRRHQGEYATHRDAHDRADDDQTDECGTMSVGSTAEFGCAYMGKF